MGVQRRIVLNMSAISMDLLKCVIEIFGRRAGRVSDECGEKVTVMLHPANFPVSGNSCL